MAKQHNGPGFFCSLSVWSKSLPVIRFELFADISNVIGIIHRKKVDPLIYSANTFPLAMRDLGLFIPLLKLVWGTERGKKICLIVNGKISTNTYNLSPQTKE